MLTDFDQLYKERIMCGIAVWYCVVLVCGITVWYWYVVMVCGTGVWYFCVVLPVVLLCGIACGICVWYCLWYCCVVLPVVLFCCVVYVVWYNVVWYFFCVVNVVWYCPVVSCGICAQKTQDFMWYFCGNYHRNTT